MATPARTTSPATRATKRPRREPSADFELISRDEDAGTITGRIFGREEFEFVDEVNGYLMLKAAGGSAKGIHQLFLSLLHAPDDATDADRRAVEERWDACMMTERHLTVERLFDLLNAITEAQGNDQAD